GLGRHRFDEPITPARHRLNVSRARALIAKNGSGGAYHDVKTVVKVHVPVGPQPALNLLTSNQLPGSLEQQIEQVDRLSGELDRLPSSLEAPPTNIKCKVSERLHHCSPLFRAARGSDSTCRDPARKKLSFCELNPPALDGAMAAPD